ncbi:PLDc N-terminal domain-containing protein [Anthocerotibacter panamensis]|uniref:PLDc N-terminal domain-containing protein n=1 Tax=Anthocerotibacter panamensis TaxID=2857077 RepID=UPI001C406B4E|nr:PLDc N-terminal domain-containing protein [Anthocerotibacter panamensis]
MLQVVVWVVLGLLAVSVVSTVFKLGVWLLGLALSALWLYALVDVLLLSNMSLLKKVLWGLGVSFLPVIGPLAWVALKPSTQRLIS